MPKLIKDGVITDDPWLAPCGTPEAGHIFTLAQWDALEVKAGSAVQIEPGESLDSLLPHLGDIALIAINFPVFTDGRGFSYARELRERGYTGELRAVGDVLVDQLAYMRR
ncbi:MAG: DUF934 domain-containing protein, partial [Halioglobus sp.]|nr:DUF934 domain-containing protein [Halioglobus sp.]